ncbi:MAG: hypothetical protein R3C44_03175 [Chloroflexota bacterium]
MDLIKLLQDKQTEIVSEASDILQRSRLQHYAEDGATTSRERLNQLYELMLLSLETHNLVPTMEYTEKIATERFEAGYDLREVQTAINVLEETIWKEVVAAVPRTNWRRHWAWSAPYWAQPRTLWPAITSR